MTWRELEAMAKRNGWEIEREGDMWKVIPIDRPGRLPRQARAVPRRRGAQGREMSAWRECRLAGEVYEANNPTWPPWRVCQLPCCGMGGLVHPTICAACPVPNLYDALVAVADAIGSGDHARTVAAMHVCSITVAAVDALAGKADEAKR